MIWCVILVAVSLHLVVCQNNSESIRLTSDQCNPKLQNCAKVANNCVDLNPPTLTLTCQQIAANKLCELPQVTDGKYCKASCETCETCGTTLLGCTCKPQWSYGNDTFDGCANPDNDNLGWWCEVVPNSCAGFNTTKYQMKQNFDYCSKDCLNKYKITEQDSNNNDADGDLESFEFSTLTQIPKKPDVVLTVVGVRIFTITNFEAKEVDMFGWKILGGTETLLYFDDQCQQPLNSTLQPLESVYLGYGTSSCQVSSRPSDYMRLVDQNERVISNVNTTQVVGDWVSCYFDGEHEITDTLECPWL